MIICDVNDAEKIQIFSVRAKLFVHFNNPYILTALHVNDISHPIRIGVQYMATSLYEQAIFILS